MELRINCNQVIELNNFASLNNIGIDIMSYDIDKEALTGDVKICGEYKKKIKDGTTAKGFEEIVPFTVVFRTDKFKIGQIYIENFNFQEEPYKGVKCKFEIVIQYTQEDEQQNKPQNEEIEIPVETEQIIAVIKQEEEQGLEECKQNEEEFTSNEEEISNITEVENQEAQEITKEYDDILKDILLERKDNFFEPTSNVSIVSTKSSERVSLRRVNDCYRKINVYYGVKEHEIEKIAKLEKIPVEDIFKTNRDFQATKRIIIQ